MSAKYFLTISVIFFKSHSCTVNHILENNSDILKNEDAILHVVDLITKYGYKVEEHNVITQDGYILTMYRLPNSGPPVLIMHGIFNSADDFITIGPNKALPYVLFNSSYDVWLGNARGTIHSGKHIKWSIENNKAEFFDFSFHEIGYYDLPAMIDYILKDTNRHKINFVGHSQGGTAFFVMCAERPEYNNKVEISILIDPAIYLFQKFNAFVQAAKFGPILETMMKSQGIYEMFAPDQFFSLLKNELCVKNVDETRNIICAVIFNLIVANLDFSQVDFDNMPVVIAHIASRTSVKQAFHYLQEIASGKFRKYDHGIRNRQVYGTTEPPEYKMENVVAPTVIFYARNGNFVVSIDDINKLANNTKNLEFFEVPYERFSHFDYLFAKNANEVVYKKILETLNFHNQLNDALE